MYYQGNRYKVSSISQAGAGSVISNSPPAVNRFPIMFLLMAGGIRSCFLIEDLHVIHLPENEGIF